MLWRNPKPVPECNFREIVECALQARSGIYWHRDGLLEDAVNAAEAVRDQGDEAIINAIERVIKQGEFICNFDDPCDYWRYF